MMSDQLKKILYEINDQILKMGNNSGLLSSLDGWNSALNAYAAGISHTVVQPIAYTLLALFFMLELYNLSQRMATLGGSPTVGVQQLSFSMIKMALCKWAVDSAGTLVTGIFAISEMITKGMAEYVSAGNTSASLDIETLVNATANDKFGQIGAWVALQVPSVIIWIAGIGITVIIAARFIELYVYVAIAPIPLSTFCSQELKNIGVNFLKNFSAVCLQGCFIYLVIGFFPAMINCFSVSSGSLVEAAWGMAGLSLVLLFAVFSCGRWAKSVCNAM